MKERVIALIDMQSFYASVEKAKVPSYRDKPLVVAGDPAKRSGIILAACPLAKKFGVTTAEPLWSALQKCPDLIVVRPHMSEYIDVSMHILRILQSYTDMVESYSIDEHFADFTGSQHLFANNTHDLAVLIQQKIMIETGIFCKLGFSENKVCAKLCLDLVSKKIPSGIFHLHKNDLSKYIWDKPVRDMWGIGSRMHKHLYKMGIHTIGDLANTPLYKLRDKWGVNGEVIWRTANGIDDSPVTVDTHRIQKNIGNGLTLPFDLNYGAEVDTILLEISSEVTRRARKKKLMGSVVSVGISGADFDHPTGFHRQMKIADPTNITSEVYEAAKVLFYKHWDRLPVRRVSVSLSELVDSDTYQISLFDNKEQQRAVDKVMDDIKDRFGEISILRASSLTSAGQAREREQRIGGHYK